MIHKNIVLIGFMGTGKSSVGKILAKRTNRVCVDIDHRIEEAQKRKIAEIFEKDGEVYFRKLEKDMVRDVASGKNLVITTGGGVVLDPENMERLKQNGLLLGLLAHPETVYQRVKDSKHRPLLKAGDGLGEIRRLMDQRRPLYAKADASFHTDGKTAAQVASDILEALEKDEEFDFGKDWF